MIYRRIATLVPAFVLVAVVAAIAAGGTSFPRPDSFGEE